MRKSIMAGILVAGMAGLTGEAAAQADAKGLIERGKMSFMLYCFVCHGEDGKGLGPMAPLLKVAPADLSKLRKPEQKEFPYEAVWDSVEGRIDTKGHGARKMPLWGPAFGDRKSVMMNELVYFLESIQAIK